MKIVQICPYELDRPGGVQNHMRSLADALVKHGHEVVTVAPGPAPSAPPPDRIYVGRRREIGMSDTRFEISHAKRVEIDAVAARLAHWGAELFHFHTIWVPSMPLTLFRRARAAGAATVATFHDTPSDSLFGRLLRVGFSQAGRALLDRLDGAIAVSKAPSIHLRPGPRGVRPVILPPAVDLAPFAAIEKRSSPDRFTVLFVGRLEPRKGIEVLLAAWRRVIERTEHIHGAPPPRLVIAGSGRLAADVHAAGAALPEGAVVHVDKPDDREVREQIAAADIMVAPSPYGESFGIVLIEAMAAATPIVAAANKGYRTVMTGKAADSLVTPGDAEALAQAILRLRGDAHLRSDLADWGRGHALTFDIAAQIPRFEAVYESALKRRKERHR